MDKKQQQKNCNLERKSHMDVKATPLHYAAQMCGYEGKSGKSSKSLALEILDILLKHPKTKVAAEDKDGRQALLWAASCGSVEAIFALVKAGANAESCDK